MALDRLDAALRAELSELERRSARKGSETVITGAIAPEGGRGRRYRIEGEGERGFLRMNSNGYLGMAWRPELLAAEEAASRSFGTGPQAVRFISGTFAPHVSLERRLAAFHGREAGMIFSSAYAAIMGILPPLLTTDTAVVSDALNHNCIINAIRLGRPAAVHVYAHLDMGELERALQAAVGCRRALIVSDGVFSMRGDHAPLERLTELARAYDEKFPENVCVIVDDSHGVGALGETGRGTEEQTGSHADLLVATLGKAFGVNGGYVVGSEPVIAYLREKSPFYVYSNPITAGEAAAASAALDLLEGERGAELLTQLRAMTARFARGVLALGYEIIPGEHPVVPILVRDAERTAALVRHLRGCGILATGLQFPVVPQGDDCIRFQLSAEHTEADVDEALAALASFR